MNLLYENQSRKIDNLGRVTIPKPIRDRLGWEQNDEIEFYTMDGASVVLSKGKMRDSRYDIAKLAQCIIGDYDYIVNDLFVLTKDGYKLYTNKTDEFKKTLFDVVTNNFNKKDIIFLTAIQFMTMIPLHAENKKHQTVMKYKSIELLSKLKQLTEDKL